MNDFIENMLKDIDGQNDKNSFKKDVEYLRKEIDRIKKEFETKTDESLHEIKEPKPPLFFCVEKYESILIEFLKIYHFGFITKFNLEKNGYFSCEIKTSVSPPHKKETLTKDTLDFKENITKLKKMNIDFVKVHSLAITLDAKSISYVFDVLKKINAKNISCKINKVDDLEYVEYIRFCTYIKDLENFDQNVPQEQNNKETMLTEDEKSALKDILCSIRGNYSLTGSDDKRTKKAIKEMITDYKKICMILDIAPHLNDKEKEIFEKNLKNKSEGYAISKEKMMEMFSAFIKKSEEIMLNHANFKISKAHISKNDIKITFETADDDYYVKSTAMSKKEFEEKFKTIKTKNQTSHLQQQKLCEENIEKIKEELFKISDCANIDSIVSKTAQTCDYKNVEYLYSIYVTFENI